MERVIFLAGAADDSQLSVPFEEPRVPFLSRVGAPG
jgi:hypothetical protein